NIDHLVVSPAGVHVIDAKRYRGRVERRKRLFEPPALYVAGRNRTKLVNGVQRQIDAVRAALPSAEQVAVSGYLCFVDSDWGLFGSPFEIDGVGVLPPKALSKAL